MGAPHVTSKDFKHIKMLQEAGLKPKQVKEISGRGMHTVQLIFQAETLYQYKKNARAFHERYRKETKTMPEIPTFEEDSQRVIRENSEEMADPEADEPLDWNPRFLQVYVDQASSLLRIAIALENIARHLEQPSKKSKFLRRQR